MDFTIELCPIVNKGKSIQKIQETIPSIESREGGFTVPLMSTTCVLSTEAAYEIPLAPIGCDPFKDGELGSLKWWQRYHDQFNPADPENPIKIPEGSWLFESKIPQGFSEGTCSKCFPNVGDFRIVGNLGFKTDWLKIYGNIARWQVAREDLPFPGEYLIVLTVIPGNGDLFVPEAVCAPPKCGALGGSCYYPHWQMQTTGTYYIVADGFFSTPTWTSGKIEDYYTDELGWSTLGDKHLTYPDCSVYGNPTLKYKVRVEGALKEITSVGFGGYGIGTHVSLRKIEKEYFEPFDDDVLGISGSVVMLPWHIMGYGG
jgi:hypothetical protein